MKLSPLFVSGAVLQAEKPLRVFGTGAGHIYISINGNTFEGEMTSDNWCAVLPALPCGGPYTLTARLDGDEQLLTDLWAGDVVLLGGQSNMKFRLSESDTPVDSYKGDSLIRLYSSLCPEAGEPYTPADGWIPLTAENARYWSCIGYHLGHFLRKKNNRPLGLITCYQGAADIQSFLPDYVFEEHPEFNLPDEERFDMAYPWNAGHSQIWKLTVEPLFPLSAAGVIWYQGESNCAPKEAPLYGDMLTAMIQSWRNAFEDENLPFVIIQIADFEPRLGEPWSTIQRAQSEAERFIHNVKTVISADVCERDLIHPTHKTELSRRAADALEYLMRK